MRFKRTRQDDATFDLNLAPVLDIIVSIVPMLLLSVAFVQVKMLEVPTPQVVSEKNQTQQPPKPEVSVSLRVSKKNGFSFEITDLKGVMKATPIAMVKGQFDFEGLLSAALQAKLSYPDLEKLQLLPEGDVAFDDLVKVMDLIRQKPIRAPAQISISDAASAAPVKNEYLFPEIIFGSIASGG